MGYGGRYRNRRYRYSGWSTPTPSHRDQVSKKYGGIDSDVRDFFFALDPFTLKLVFNKYETEFGSGKRKYAEASFAKWKSGQVQMGGVISDRLVTIVPHLLSFDQKYFLLSKMWSKLRDKQRLSFSISPLSDLDEVISTIMHVASQGEKHDMPESVANRLAWLSSDDGVAARTLLEQVERHETEIAVQTLELELSQLLRVAVSHSDKRVRGSRSIDLPFAEITVNISQHAPKITKGRSMASSTPNDEPDARQDQLANRGPDKDLAPIQNPSDLMGEALKRMSASKQQEIIGKATDEALRLQVKQREGQLDHEMASRMVEKASDTARSMESLQGHNINYEAEHKSEHGSVRISVSSKQSVKSRVGGCFIATATYGDCSHPTVIELRAFRDEHLKHKRLGRDFIAWYYRNSPPIARVISNSTVLRWATRVSLLPVVFAVKMIRYFD